jgi:hypothetical protein
MANPTPKSSPSSPDLNLSFLIQRVVIPPKSCHSPPKSCHSSPKAEDSLLPLPLPFFLSFPPGICFFFPCPRDCTPGPTARDRPAEGEALRYRPKQPPPLCRPLYQWTTIRARARAPPKTLSTPQTPPKSPNPLYPLAINLFKTWHSYPTQIDTLEVDQKLHLP